MVDAGISAAAAAIKNRSSALITGSRPRWREAGCQRQQMRQHRSPTDTKPAGLAGGAAGERGELRPTAPLPVAALIALPAQGSLSSLSLARGDACLLTQSRISANIGVAADATLSAPISPTICTPRTRV